MCKRGSIWSYYYGGARVAGRRSPWLNYKAVYISYGMRQIPDYTEYDLLFEETLDLDFPKSHLYSGRGAWGTVIEVHFGFGLRWLSEVVDRGCLAAVLCL